MNNHIIITQEQANLIRGKYGIYSAIEPISTPDGNFIVPENCLSDIDLISVKDQLQAMKKTDNVQDIQDVEHTVIFFDGKLATHNGLMICTDTVGQSFTYDMADLREVKKSVLIENTLTVDKDQITALNSDADGNIRKLAGNVKRYVVDLTEGKRTTATDSQVNTLIADGNIIITAE